MLFRVMPEQAKPISNQDYPVKAQQIEAERAIESQHAVYTLTSISSMFCPSILSIKKIFNLQEGHREGFFLDYELHKMTI